MPKLTIYVPDPMYDQLRQRGLPISQLAQRAFAEALAGDANLTWIARARERPVRAQSVSTEDLMAGVDEDFGA